MRNLAILGAALLVAGAAACVNSGTAAAKDDSASGASAEIESAQAEAAAGVKNQLPVQIDKVTTLQDVSADGATLINRYVLAVDASKMNLAVFADKMKTQLKGICDQGQTAAIISHGGSYRYVFKSTDDRDLGDFLIDKAACASQ